MLSAIWEIFSDFLIFCNFLAIIVKYEIIIAIIIEIKAKYDKR